MCSSQWIQVTQEEPNYQITWKPCSDQWQWWFLTMHWLHKSCCSQKVLKLPNHWPERWYSYINCLHNNWVNKITTILVWEPSRVSWLWLGLWEESNLNWQKMLCWSGPWETLTSQSSWSMIYHCLWVSSKICSLKSKFQTLTTVHCKEPYKINWTLLIIKSQKNSLQKSSN